MKHRFPKIAPAILLGALILPGCSKKQQVEQVSQVRSTPQNASFSAPPGFTVEQVATSDVTGSVINLTFDSKGRAVISRERGPIVILEDLDHDGKLESQKIFTDKVTNCQGLCFVGNALYAVGDVAAGTKETLKASDELKREFEIIRARNIEDARAEKPDADGKPAKPRGITGLYRIDDTNGDDSGDEVTIVGLIRGGMGEHGPHAVIVGPDGLLYFVIGNHAWPTISSEPLAPHTYFEEAQLLPSYLDARGHARNIRAPGGTIWRLDLDGTRWERVAGGFRNEFDAAFNLAGELFTFDSDMEWDINLPWYRPCRAVHVVPGGEYGWRTGSGKWPAYFPDSLPAVSDIGRGSPVGMDFYQHQSFPAKYNDALFMGDWSRGRILAAIPKRAGATYSAEVEEFIQGEPMNVTDLAIGPDGALYFSNGGRATDGGLYRVSFKADAIPAATGIEAAIHQAQPRSAWGREALRTIREKMGDSWDQELTKVLQDEAKAAEIRVRALELMHVYGKGLDEQLLIKLGNDKKSEVRASAVYYLGLHRTDSARQELLSRLKDDDAFVRRRACEAIIRTGLNPAMEVKPPVVAAVVSLAGDSDRFVRYAARLVLERIDRNKWHRAVLSETRPDPAIAGLIALNRTMRGSSPDIEEMLGKELALLKTSLSTEQRLDLIRAIHLTFLNDEGVQRPKYYDPIGSEILAAFPAGDWRLNREYARTLAHLQTPGGIEKILKEQGKEKNTEQQIFYAYCLRNLRGEWTAEQQEAVIQWFAKTQKEQWKGGASFTGYLEFVWNSWLANLPAEVQTKAKTRLSELVPTAVAGAGDFSRKKGNMTLSNQELSEYLLLDPMAYKLGKDTFENGRKAFETAGCVACHRVGDLGNAVGPDLTDVGRRFKRKDLIESILYPSKTISDQWQAVEIRTNDGKIYVGVVQSQDNSQVTLRLVSRETVNIPVSQIRSRETARTSLMPEGLLNNLDVGETSNLLLFLEKGTGSVPKK